METKNYHRNWIALSNFLWNLIWNLLQALPSYYFALNFSKKKNLTFFTSKKKSELKVEEYQLFSVVTHFGTLENGHYFSYVRHPRAMWVKCEDAFISKTSAETVLNTQAFVLVFFFDLLPFILTYSFLVTCFFISKSVCHDNTSALISCNF